MAKIKFNEKKLQSMKAVAKRLQVFDAGQPGLCLRVTPDGTKSFSVVYKVGGRMKRLTLGKYPAVTLADARKRTRAALAEVESGKDPQEEKVTVREAGTLAELAEIYMAEHSEPNKKSAPDDRRMLTAYLLPVLKNTKAAEVTIDDCEMLLEGIARTAPVQANRVRALLRHIFTWSLAKRKYRKQFVLTMNPCEYVQRLTEEKARERVYSDEEMKALWKAFDKIGMVGDLFKLQLLLGVRKGELVQVEWSEIELERGVWNQPGAKTKNGRPHIVPLPSQAVRILESLKQRQAKLKNESKKDSRFVFFSSRTGAEPMTWLQKAAMRARTESKVEDFQAHDLRRTCATRLAEAGTPDAVLEMILNHSLGKDVTSVHYNQYRYFHERQAALQSWANRLMVIVSDLKAVETAENETELANA